MSNSGLFFMIHFAEEAPRSLRIWYLATQKDGVGNHALSGWGTWFFTILHTVLIRPIVHITVTPTKSCGRTKKNLVCLWHKLLIWCIMHHTALWTFDLKVRDITHNTLWTVGHINTVFQRTEMCDTQILHTKWEDRKNIHLSVPKFGLKILTGPFYLQFSINFGSI